MNTAKIKKILKIVFVSVFALLLIIGTSWTVSTCSKSERGDFTWFITKDDSKGQLYYKNYNEALVVQYLNTLNWDVENGGITKNGGVNVNLSFQTPAVSAADSLNNMFASGDTTDLVDLQSTESKPKKLVQDGTLMELTEYVEQYMPNYLAFIEANPDVAKFVREKDENGKYHYYALYQVADEPNDNFQGHMYRRDWLVRYGTPTEYIWDLEQIVLDEIKDEDGKPETDTYGNVLKDYTSLKKYLDNGTIKYTSYAQAKAAFEAGDTDAWKGWKKNTVTQFTSSEGDDPNNDYTDNVIFPSGEKDPHYVSDWEWMLDIFLGVVGDARTNSDENQCALTIYTWGFNGMGDFFSSFGGGHPSFYLDKNNKVKMGANSSTMKAYIECMSEWYNKGYVDRSFISRTGQPWEMNLSGFQNGMVAMGAYGMAYPGTSIRKTAKDENKDKAMVWGCSLPINDLYGEEENKFTTPDAMYSASKLSTRSATGISVKAKDNEKLPALLRMLDYFYSEEGACLLTFGLNGEQYKELKKHGITGKDCYAENGLTDGTYTTEVVDGITKYKRVKAISIDSDLQGAVNGQRMIATMQINGKIISTYDYSIRHSMDEWRRYYNSTDITNYTTFLEGKDETTYNAANNFCMSGNGPAGEIPKFVKSKEFNENAWNDYLATFSPNGIPKAIKALQQIVDSLG